MRVSSPAATRRGGDVRGPDVYLRCTCCVPRMGLWACLAAGKSAVRFWKLQARGRKRGFGSLQPGRGTLPAGRSPSGRTG